MTFEAGEPVAPKAIDEGQSPQKMHLLDSFQPDAWQQHSQSIASLAPSHTASESRAVADAMSALQTQLQEALEDNSRLSILAKSMKKRHTARVKELKLEITALKCSNKNLHGKLNITKEALETSESDLNEA